MRVTLPAVTAETPTSVLRSRYHRHSVRAAVSWQGEKEQMAIGTTGEAYRLSVMAVESRDYAELLRQELRRRNVAV